MSVVGVGRAVCPYCGKRLDAAEAYLHITTCSERPRGVRMKYV